MLLLKKLKNQERCGLLALQLLPITYLGSFIFKQPMLAASCLP
jgi:hypothetical protein